MYRVGSATGDPVQTERNCLSIEMIARTQHCGTHSYSFEPVR